MYLSELKPSECTVTGMLPDGNGQALRIYVKHPIFQGQEKVFKREFVGKDKVHWKHVLEHTESQYGFIIKKDISQTNKRKKR
jgi:hypothetical protein